MAEQEPKPEGERYKEIQTLISQIEKEYPSCTQEEINKATQTAIATFPHATIQELKEKIKSNLSWAQL